MNSGWKFFSAVLLGTVINVKPAIATEVSLLLKMDYPITVTMICFYFLPEMLYIYVSWGLSHGNYSFDKIDRL